MNTVTYKLENGTKIVQPINNQALVGERGRQKTEAEMNKLFSETAWDKRAVSFTIDSEENDKFVKDKEIHFSKVDKKLAKAQLKLFKKNNPQGFKKSLTNLQAQLVDIVQKKKVRMNIKNIQLQ